MDFFFPCEHDNVSCDQMEGVGFAVHSPPAKATT